MLALLAVVAASPPAFAHGGNFRGPSNGVPPGLRPPTDPEPPPPPPSEPGEPGGPVTPSEPQPAPQGPLTPNDPGAPPVAPPAADPRPGKGRTTRSAPITYESWRYWWAYNNDEILSLRNRGGPVSSSSPVELFRSRDEGVLRRPQRATDYLVQTVVRAALARRIDDPFDHEDVHGGAIIADAKVGTASRIGVYAEILAGRYRGADGRAVGFGLQATESAAIALGLLPGLDEAGRAAAREVCLGIVADGARRTRERAWAAVALGLQRDADAAAPLFRILVGTRFPDDNVPCGILAGLGLMGPGAADRLVPGESGGERPLLEALLRIFDPQTERIGAADVTDRLRAFAGYALAKLERPEALPAILKILRNRSVGVIHRRSAAIAAGVLGALAADGAEKERAADALCAYLRRASDLSGANFAIIALGQIGTPDAVAACRERLLEGKGQEVPFAALSLAFHHWRAARGGGAQDASALATLQILRKRCEEVKDQDTLSALFLARGILRDRSAREAMTGLAADPGKEASLRGYCCVALGLLGAATDETREALLLALREKKSADLRRDAATGLGLLRDAGAVKVLLQELGRASSFAVQAQIVQAIGAIGDASAIDPLVEILDDTKGDVNVRALAAVGLGMIGDPEDLPRLARLSRDYNYRATVKDLDELLYIF